MTRQSRIPTRRRDSQSGAAQPDLFSTPQVAMIAASTLVINAGDHVASSRQSEVRPRRAVTAKQVAVERPPNGLLRVREAAARLGLSKSTLDKMRCDGRGPKFVKITGKIVGYDPADLDAYTESRKTTPTA